VGRLGILYFLEDRAQERFLVSLVERVALDISIPREAITSDVRSSRGGSRVIGEFETFVRDLRGTGMRGADIIVVAIDGDCDRPEQRAKQLKGCVQDTDPFGDVIVYAIPDPHIERWYLLDQEALKKGTGLTRGISPPAHKCERGYYKRILRDALREQGVDSLVGGSEFAPEIARNISDLYAAGKQDDSFAKFVASAKAALRRAYRTASPD
jgi:hypothetical protein